jgi:hypothetical protein
MKKILILLSIGFLGVFLSSKTITVVVPQEIKTSQDTIKRKMTDQERKEMEYMNYRTRAEKVDRNMQTIEKQIILTDSILKIDSAKNKK